MTFLVEQSKIIAHQELVEEIYKSGNYDALVVEDPAIANQRNQCTKMIAALKKS